MITIDASVVMKWFKTGERFETEALDLRGRINRQKVQASASEIVSLEVVRGLKRNQRLLPALGITDAMVLGAFAAVEGMFQTGLLQECRVSTVKMPAKDIEMVLSLFMSDALHLATAIHLKSSYFVADDQDFFKIDVVKYAAGFGVAVVSLPDLITGLNLAAGSGPSVP